MKALSVVKKGIAAQSKIRQNGTEDFDNVMLDVAFAEGVHEVLNIIAGHGLLDEVDSGAATALLSEAAERFDRIKAYIRNTAPCGA